MNKRRIIISESQYKRVFLSEQDNDRLSQDIEKCKKYKNWMDHSKALGCGACSYDAYKLLATKECGHLFVLPYVEIKMNTGNFEIDQGIIPGNTYDACKPKSVVGGGILPKGVTWCDIINAPGVDCYMGGCSVKYKGQTYTWRQDGGSGMWSLESPNFSSSELVPQTNYDISKYITNWNNVLSRYNEISKLAKWDGSIILIDDKWLDKNKNDLNAKFQRGNDETNIYNPSWVIKSYFESQEALEVDWLTIIKQEEYAKKWEEDNKKYKKELELWRRQLDAWSDKFGARVSSEELKSKAKQASLYSQSNIYHSEYNPNVRSEENYPRPYDYFPKLEDRVVSYDNNNPFGKSYTKKEEENILKTYGHIPKVKPDGGIDGIKNFQNWLDSKNLKWVDGANLNKGPGYGKFGPRTKLNWDIYGAIYEWETSGKSINEIPSKPEKPKYSGVVDTRGGEYLSDLEDTINFYKVLLSAIDSYNQPILTQNKRDIVEFCNVNKKVNSLGQAVPENSRIRFGHQQGAEHPHLSQNRFDKAPDAFKHLAVEYKWWYSDICPEYGGVWVYSQGKNSKVCGCVNTPDEEFFVEGGTVNLWGVLEHKLETTDIRSSWEKFTDWAGTCADDWHCLADIASIAVLFIPVPGLNVGLSAAIDLISGAGYIIEGEEGWELNAGLTLLGSFASGVDVFKYTNKALKGGSEMVNLRKGLGNALDKAEQTKLTPEWSRLNGDKYAQSKLYSKKFREGLKGMSSQELKDLSNIMRSFTKNYDDLAKSINDIVGDINKVTKSEKASLQDILEKMAKDPKLKREIADHIIANGGKIDIKSILKKFGSQSILRATIIQAGLFSLAQYYPEETATVIKGAIEFADILLGTEMSKGWKDVADADKSDKETKELVEKMQSDLLTYELLSIDVEQILETKMPAFLAKYNITSKDIESIDKVRKLIFNGLDSFAGKDLENTKIYLNSLFLLDEEIRKNNTNLSEEELYNKIREDVIERYNETFNYLLELSKNQKDNVFNKINDFQTNPENKLTPEEKAELEKKGFRF